MPRSLCFAPFIFQKHNIVADVASLICVELPSNPARGAVHFRFFFVNESVFPKKYESGHLGTNIVDIMPVDSEKMNDPNRHCSLILSHLWYGIV